MTAICSRCQTALAPDELEGLCPRCLLLQALPPEHGQEPIATASSAFTPLTVAELTPLFPQLEILELLGQGGMGAVYKARQIKLDRLVAVKLLSPAAANDPSFAERFVREARALARLAHPHIVAVYDFGDVSGLYYLLMEFVEGVTLRQALAAGGLGPQQALALVCELCSALQYAHEKGVVHRDVKPENVLLDRQGNVKVADFGLAKLVGQPQSPSRLTTGRHAMGTPLYMAPEQWEKPMDVDHRADVYSLGVVFYELLTGELPIGKFAPPSHKPGVDVRLDEVVLRAIEKQPELRYQKMSEMKVAVEAAGQEPSAEEPAPGSLLDWLTRKMTKKISGALKKFGVDSQTDDDETDSFPGLTPQQEKLRRLLLKVGEELSGDFSVLPDIEPDLLNTAREQCRAAPEDRILAVLDFGDGGGDGALLFGCAGLYWCNGDDTPHAGTGSLPYAELSERRIVSHGNVVYLGKDQFLCPNPDETGIDCEELVRMLSKVQKVMAPRPA
jgi:serine/threonine protein kinase